MVKYWSPKSLLSVRFRLSAVWRVAEWLNATVLKTVIFKVKGSNPFSSLKKKLEEVMFRRYNNVKV
jgi:hypothetical protein